MLIHKLPPMSYTAFPLDWQVCSQENTVSSAFSIFISWRAMDLVGKPNTTSPIWIISIHVTHLRLYKCLQVHLIAYARLVRCVWWGFLQTDQIRTRNMATYGAIPIPQRARAADEELTRPLARWRNSEPCLNRTPRRNTTCWVCLQDIWTVSVCHK